MHRWSQRLPTRVIVVAVLILSAVAQFLPQPAEAAGLLTESYIRLDRMKINTATGFTVCAKPTTTATEAQVQITFPSTYTLSNTASNYVVDSTNIPTGTTFWLGMTSGTTTATSASNASHQVVFPSGNLVVGTLYCFHVTGTSTVTTAAAAANSQQANIETQTSTPTAIDDGYVALANNTDDTIVVTAVVPPSFIFTLSGYTDQFTTNLDPLSVVSTSGVTAQVITNAKGGWIAWAKDTDRSPNPQGLRSATAAYTIATAGTVGDGNSTQLTPGTEGYVMDVLMTTDAGGGCTVGIDPDYDGTTQAQPTRSGGTLSNIYQKIANCTGTAPATANGDVITMVERAAISAITPAGTDYTDSITVVGAGDF